MRCEMSELWGGNGDKMSWVAFTVELEEAERAKPGVRRRPGLRGPE